MYKLLTKILTTRVKIGIAITLIVLFFYESSKKHSTYAIKVKEEHSCQYYKEREIELRKLVQLVHDILETYRLEHFVHFGSIWGVLRGYKGPLPWDYDADFGVMYCHNTVYKLEMICKELISRNLTCGYHYGGGRYKIKRKSKKFKVGVDLFLSVASWYGYVRRLGWEVWVIPWHYHLHQSFPTRFIEGKLPKREFAGRNISVPKGGIEVMKYLYRYSWDKVVKPKNGCWDEK